MDMYTMGSVANTVKQMELQFKWQERKNNPLLDKEGQNENSMIAELKRQAAEASKSQKMSSIDTKLKTGVRLSAHELEYLKINNPDLYEKAVKIEKEREEYRRQLRNAKTKEDVERLQSQRVQQLTAEAQAISGNPNIPKSGKQGLLEEIGMRMAAAANEYVEYVNSAKYAGLPENEEESKFSVKA